MPEFPDVPDEFIEQAFPGGFSLRDEANALVAYVFRNGPLEDLHAGKESDLLRRRELSRITDREMKALMVDACRKLAQVLELRKKDPVNYERFAQAYGYLYCRDWER